MLRFGFSLILVYMRGESERHSVSGGTEQSTATRVKEKAVKT